jgi:hypothetical protein
MSHDDEIHAFLLRHLRAIFDNDIQAYHATTSEELSLYEWWVTPHRLDGLPFHDFMMQENALRGTVFGADSEQIDFYGEKPRTRYDLSNLNIQRYGDTAIASYTLLVSTGDIQGVKVVAHNESRVIVKLGGELKVVHVHKSPAWPAPHTEPVNKAMDTA